MDLQLVFILLISFMYSIHGTIGATTITNVTLVDGQTPNEGRVEYIRQDASTWESACGNGLDYDEASVICRQLGYPGVNNVVAQWPFGAPTSISQSRLNCNGDEMKLADCSLLSVSSCSNTGGVICYDSGYLGCYPYSALLPEDLQTPCEYGFDDNQEFTIVKCVSLCSHSNDNYTYAGLYRGEACLCGNASTVIGQSDWRNGQFCSSPCAGRNIERCGGVSDIAMFNISSFLRMPIDLPPVSCRPPPKASTTAVLEATTSDVSTFAASSPLSMITTISSLSSWPSSSSLSSSTSPPSSSSSPSSSSTSSLPLSSTSSSSLPSSQSPSSSSLPLSSSGIMTNPYTTILQSHWTSGEMLSSISGSSPTTGVQYTSNTSNTSERALSIALGVTAFLFVCTIVIFYMILRRRNSQRYETNIAHMNYSGSLDNSFFVSRLSRQDLIPPDLNNGGVSPRESILMDGAPRDSTELTNSNGQFDTKFFALGPRQQHPPLPLPNNRDRHHRESFDMERSARDSIADRPSSFFAPGTTQHSPTTPDSNNRERNHRASFYLNRSARDSIYENDERSDHDDHIYESVILDQIRRNHDQSTV